MKLKPLANCRALESHIMANPCFELLAFIIRDVLVDFNAQTYTPILVHTSV